MIMYFDGSRCEQGCGSRFVFVIPQGVPMPLSFKISFECTNKNVEYEALILGLKLSIEMKYEGINIYRYLLLIINQVKGIYSCNHPHLKLYKAMVEILLEHLKVYDLKVIPRYSNHFADTMASLGSLIPQNLFKNITCDALKRPLIKNDFY